MENPTYLETEYIYGSHDFYNGYVFCIGDYVCWSASVDDLSDWRYEGVIYKRCADPLNSAGKMCLYAPDVTVGPDGRDGDKEQGYIANIQDTATAGFKYFDCHNITAMSISAHRYAFLMEYRQSI